MSSFHWNQEKNSWLKSERGICFEDTVFHIERGDILDIIDNPDRVKYPNQKIFIVAIEKYAYMVPFFEDEKGYHLITVIPSRKLTKKYLGG